MRIEALAALLACSRISRLHLSYKVTHQSI